MYLRQIFLPALLLLTMSVHAQAPGETAEAHLSRGYEALKLDRYDQAATEFRAALAIDGNLVERAQFPLAVALFELHRPEDARKELEAVRQKVGDHPNVLYYLGRIELELHNFRAASDDLEKAAQNPPFPDIYYYLGFAKLKLDELPAAEKWLTKADEVMPNDARVPYQLGLLYQKEGRPADSSKWLSLSEEIRKRDERDTQAKAECARLLDAGKLDEAHATCRQLYDDSNAERLTALGTLYAQHGDPHAALKPLQRAAELAPQSPQMQYNLALDYFQMNQFEDARAPLETALKRWPDLFDLNFLYGAVLLNLGDDQHAYGVLTHAHELSPQDAMTNEMLYSALLSLANKEINGGEPSQAIARLHQAVKLDSSRAEPHELLSELYRKLGQTQEADSEKQKAAALKKSPAAH